MVGGVVVNVLLAFLIYAMVLFVWGDEKLPMSNIKDGVWINNTAISDLGFRTGDQLVSFDGKTVKYYGEAREEMIYAKEIKVNRNGQIVSIPMPEDFVNQISKAKQGLFQVRTPFIIDHVLDSSQNKSAGFLPNDKNYKH